MPAGRR